MKVPKTKSGRRQIKLSIIAVQRSGTLGEAMQEDASGVSFVSCNTEGKPLRKSNFERQVWKPLRKNAGISETVRFHDMRHMSASWLLKAGINAKVVSERLGLLTCESYSTRTAT